jgi:hypothetical protein
MALFIGWTKEELYLALDRANYYFNGNLCFDYVEAKNQKDDRYRLRLLVKEASRLKKKDLVRYPKTVQKYQDAGELLPDYLYPYGCKVNWNRGWTSGPPRGIASACWHASGQFYRELFRINPNGKIRTSLASYNGEDGFNRTFWSTENKNVGNMMNHISYADSCCCDMHGIGDEWMNG